MIGLPNARVANVVGLVGAGNVNKIYFCSIFDREVAPNSALFNLDTNIEL